MITRWSKLVAVLAVGFAGGHALAHWANDKKLSNTFVQVANENLIISKTAGYDARQVCAMHSEMMFANKPTSPAMPNSEFENCVRAVHANGSYKPTNIVVAAKVAVERHSNKM